MKRHSIKVGSVFLSLIFLCLCSISAFAQDSTPITAANAGNLELVTTIGDAEHTIGNVSVAFSPDSQYLTYADSTTFGAGVYDLAAGADSGLVLPSRYGARWLAFADDAITAVSPIGTVSRWAFPSGEELSDVTLEGASPNADPFLSADGTQVASFDHEGLALVYDTATGDLIASIPVGDDWDYADPALSPDNTMIAFVNEGGGIQIWSIADGTLLHELDSVGGYDISFSADSQMLAACSNQSSIEMWNLETGAALPTITGMYCDHTRFSPDGALLAIGTRSDVNLWDIANRTQVGSYPGDGFAFSPDGHYLATVLDDWTKLSVYAAPAGSAPVEAAATTAPTEAPAVETAVPSDTTAPTAVPAGSASASVTCTVTVINNANLRSGPGTTFDRAGSVVGGTVLEADGQTESADGFIWYRLTSGEWIREDLVTEAPECTALNVITS